MEKYSETEPKNPHTPVDSSDTLVVVDNPVENIVV